MDAFAESTAYEVSAYGIETTIVMPGPFIEGTEHFPKMEAPVDADVAADYDRLTEAIATNEKATAGLFPPGVDADPVAVAEEIARVIDRPRGTRPFRMGFARLRPSMA
jgi:NAD(P)-dependent dehydrogenase (short-subunit alcohol dehydrogenase family)